MSEDKDHDDDIEVTPEMIEAGLDRYRPHDPWFDDEVKAALVDAFRAMLRASPYTKCCATCRNWLNLGPAIGKCLVHEYHPNGSENPWESIFTTDLTLCSKWEHFDAHKTSERKK